jgi:hypothetical protein
MNRMASSDVLTPDVQPPIGLLDGGSVGARCPQQRVPVSDYRDGLGLRLEHPAQLLGDARVIFSE